MPIKFYRLPQVLELTGICRSVLYREISLGKFPKPVKIGKRAIAWPETVLDKWAQDRIAQSEANAQ